MEVVSMIKVLNKKECNVYTVGCFMGRLYYTRGFWDKAQTDITKVVVINSSISRPRDIWGAKQPTVTANVDLYTSNGTVIEILTDDRNFLNACDALTIKKDSRAYYRKQRGVY